MSRIGRLPVSVPGGVQVNVQGSNVHVKGPKGEMQKTFSSLVGIALENNHVVVTRNSDNAEERALHGTTRAVIANMIHGVSSGFIVILEIEGVGYRAEMEGKTLALHVGYSHPVKVEPPVGINLIVKRLGRSRLKFVVFARLNLIMVREFVTQVKRFVAKPVRLERERSRTWLISLVPSHAHVVMYAYAKVYQDQPNVHV